ncbi:MAG: GNAT superfamily N-acetyltransferase [Patiriisocius sp.]|jgi:GNAT superfamily N-acetyltransferase
MTTIVFSIVTNVQFAALVEQFDKDCFPEEMWLRKEDIEASIAKGAIGVVGRIDDQDICFGILIGELAEADDLKEFDPQFNPSADNMYSYSVAVHPKFQEMGSGKKLVLEMKRIAKKSGAKHLTAHVRTANDWHSRRARLLDPQIRRIVKDAWEIDGDVEFQSVEL